MDCGFGDLLPVNVFASLESFGGGAHILSGITYRAMQLRFGYGFEFCDANGPRNVKNTNPAKQRPDCFPHFSLLAVRNRS